MARIVHAVLRVGRIKIVLLLQDCPPPVRSETHSTAETKGKTERTIVWRNGVACDILKRRGVEPLFTVAEWRDHRFGGSDLVLNLRGDTTEIGDLPLSTIPTSLGWQNSRRL
jgi:hypothetical protein